MTRAAPAATVTLTDEQLDRLAARIADRLVANAYVGNAPAGRLVDAATLAARLGTSRDWVYRHWRELGGQRIGDGPHARLRFDADLALERWTTPPASPTVDAASAEVLPVGNTRSPRRRRATSADAPQLLPIRGQ